MRLAPIPERPAAQAAGVDDAVEIAARRLAQRPPYCLQAHRRRDRHGGFVALLGLFEELHRAGQGIIERGIALLNVQGESQVVHAGQQRPQQQAIGDDTGTAEGADKGGGADQGRQTPGPIESAGCGGADQQQGEQPADGPQGNDHTQSPPQGGQTLAQRVSLSTGHDGDSCNSHPSPYCTEPGGSLPGVQTQPADSLASAGTPMDTPRPDFVMSVRPTSSMRWSQ